MIGYKEHADTSKGLRALVLEKLKQGGKARDQ